MFCGWKKLIVLFDRIVFQLSKQKNVTPSFCRCKTIGSVRTCKHSCRSSHTDLIAAADAVHILS